MAKGKKSPGPKSPVATAPALDDEVRAAAATAAAAGLSCQQQSKWPVVYVYACMRIARFDVANGLMLYYILLCVRSELVCGCVHSCNMWAADGVVRHTHSRGMGQLLLHIVHNMLTVVFCRCTAPTCSQPRFPADTQPD